MRPLNKGKSPYGTIEKYADALDYLEKAIGPYCAYCEMPINHVPEVEHVAAKSCGGALTDWDNLLLGCKYCNTRKGKQVSAGNEKNYMWPDRDNTALAYRYDGGVPSVNAGILQAVDPTGIQLSKARNLFELVKLDNVPSPGQRDRRFRERNRAYEMALQSLEIWQSVKQRHWENQNDIRQQILLTARACGFFSIWMMVFEGEPMVLNGLIETFPGTHRDCFDELGRPSSEKIK